MLRRLAPALAPLAAAAALAGLGCGEDLGYQLPVVPTSGKVVWNGEPVKNALVRFHPVSPEALQPPPGQEGPQLALTSDTDASGAFVMSSYYAADGVPAGDYIVTIVPLDEAAGPQPTTETETDPTRPPAENDATLADLSPAERKAAVAAARSKGKPSFARLYRDPATSPLKATVAAGSDNTFTFELDAADSGAGARTASSRRAE